MDSSVVSNPKFASQCLIVLFSARPHPSTSPCPLPRLDGDAPAPAATVRCMLLLFLFSRLMVTPLQPSPFVRHAHVDPCGTSIHPHADVRSPTYLARHIPDPC